LSDPISYTLSNCDSPVFIFSYQQKYPIPEISTVLFLLHLVQCSLARSHLLPGNKELFKLSLIRCKEAKSDLVTNNKKLLANEWNPVSLVRIMAFTFSDLFDLLILVEKDKILRSISSQK